jgi:predicted DNA-binding protein
MKQKKLERKSIRAQKPSWVRASISFPPGLYEMLEGLAKQKKVSLAWVVRDASEKYVADQKPVSGSI